MPSLPGMAPQPSPGRNMARVAKRLKRNAAGDRGALEEIRGLLTRRGYSGMKDAADLVEAVEHALGMRDEETSSLLPAPAPALLLAAPAPAPVGVGVAPAEALAVARMAFGLPASAGPAPAPAPPARLPTFAELMAGPAPGVAVPLAAAPPVAPTAPPPLPMPTAPVRTGPLDIKAFEAKFKENATDASAANRAEADGGPRPKGAAGGGSRFLNGNTGRRPDANDQYAILERITGKHAAPAPPSGIPNAMAR
jgi:hypothetical protein